MKIKATFQILTVLLLISLSCVVSDAVLATTKLDFRRYHRYDDMVGILRDFHRAHTDISNLVSIGKSYQGKDIWLLEISRQQSGTVRERPAVFIGGGLRGDELVGTEACLATIQYLLENYSRELRVKKAVDERAFYILPMMNPDANDATAQQIGQLARYNRRPVDEDHDGRLDEDPPEDLNGDGFITMMRVPDPAGDVKISPVDSRIMIPATDPTGGSSGYKMYLEGIDNDNDKKYNEDGIGGVDLNLNFPAGWKLDHERPVSGMYPGSEPESEAVLAFLTDHPNVAFVLVYQAGAGKLFRPYYYLSDKEMPKVDLKVYEMLGKKYAQLTGYELTHGFPEADKQEKRPSPVDEVAKLEDELKRELPAELNIEDILKMGNLRELIKTQEARMYMQQHNISSATAQKLIRLQELRMHGKSGADATPGEEIAVKNVPLGGSLLDWAYRDFAAYSLSPSLWQLPVEYRITADSIPWNVRDEMSWLKFFDQELKGGGFVAWQPYQHPQLGQVEIGGRADFYKKNPPAGKRLEELCLKTASFALELAEMTPALVIKQVEVRPIVFVTGASKAIAAVAPDGGIQISRTNKLKSDQAIIAEVKVTVENIGAIGTRTAWGKKIRYAQQPVRSVLAYLEADESKLHILSMPKVLRLGVIEGTMTRELVMEETAEPTSTDVPSQTTMMEEGESAPINAETEKEAPHIKSGTWLVQIENLPTEITVRVTSETGGTVSRKLTIR
ncbi:MAG: M14 family metallopeptidase [candidate division KSB1 bacterium]|nr:M14 family metallopeptidase [candidate division KSB1 bacterium]MDZ7319579.1 M14 family metallopeptidase [candidate division KSB1 bacterium]MDZ7342443.1 M14 family metallopeptidase [candidate division KSB1 bacterium]